MRCSMRTAPAAYWAAWADVLPTLRQRYPLLAAEYVAELETGVQNTECLKEVLAAESLLRREGYLPPSYVDLAEGAKPPNPPPSELDPGERRHGWQYFAASTREKYHLETRVPP